MEFDAREVLMVTGLAVTVFGIYVALDRRVTKLEAVRQEEKEARITADEGLCERVELLEKEAAEQRDTKTAVAVLAKQVGTLEQRVGALDTNVTRGFTEVLGELRRSRGASNGPAS